MDLIKTKIIEEGVMATCLCSSSSYINGQYEHYQPASTTAEPNHSVSIVGWDDDREIASAPDDGAWLCKNSWGAGWGYDGYFWISYYDKHACQNPEMGAVSFQKVDLFAYSNVYYHDYHGWRDTLTTASEAFNKFVANANDIIAAVSFFTAESNVTCDIIIYDDYDGTSLSNELTSQQVTYENCGLHTVDLDNPVSVLSGDDFYVYMQFSDGGVAYDRTSDVPVLLGGSPKAIVTSVSYPDESYYYENNIWKDFYDYIDPSGFQNTGNFCIKALTVTAYNLEMGSLEILDPTGNNNGRLDPGETADVNFTIQNAGIYEVTDIVAELTMSDPFIIVNSGNLEFANIAPGEEEQATINISVSGNAPIGHVVDGSLGIDCISNGNDFSYSYDFTMKIGLIIDDFETGDFSAFDWSFGGEADWTITSTTPFEGMRSC